jgi:hypothetical protein
MPNYRALQIAGVTFTGSLPGAADLIPPTAPGSPTAVRYGLGVGIDWTAATDNIAVVSYEVHRSTTSGFTPSPTTLIATVVPPTAHWADNTAPVSATYYKIVARDAGGNGTSSAQVTVAELSNAQLLAPGSLVLFDPTDPTNPWVGLATAVPNLAASFADVTIGGSSALTWSNNLSQPGGLVERSNKGGLHFMVSTTVSVSNNLAYVQRSTALATYLLANPTHDMYLGVSYKNTRMAPPPGVLAIYYPYKVTVNSTVGVNNGYVAIGNQTSTGVAQFLPYSSETTRIAVNSDVAPGGETHAAVGTTDAQPNFTGSVHQGLILGGAPSAVVNQVQSHLCWRFYLEDLTVSGRNYSQVYAVDHAIHTKEVLTAGGRYYGDTYSNPVTTVP